MEIQFYTVKDVAEIYSCHPNTIYKAIKRGFIVAVRIGDKKKSPYRISRKSIDKIHESIIFQHAHKAKTLT